MIFKLHICKIFIKLWRQDLRDQQVPPFILQISERLKRFDSGFRNSGKEGPRSWTCESYFRGPHTKDGGAELHVNRK